MLDAVGVGGGDVAGGDDGGGEDGDGGGEDGDSDVVGVADAAGDVVGVADADGDVRRAGVVGWSGRRSSTGGCWYGGTYPALGDGDVVIEGRGPGLVCAGTCSAVVPGAAAAPAGAR